MQDELTYRILKSIYENPRQSQRDLSQGLGISLGKVNYCLRSLVEQGYVKSGNFRRSRKKAAYLYWLTPEGMDEKATVTMRFLKRKLEEYELMKKEIEQLRADSHECQQYRPKESTIDSDYAVN